MTGRAAEQAAVTAGDHEKAKRAARALYRRRAGLDAWAALTTREMEAVLAGVDAVLAEPVEITDEMVSAARQWDHDVCAKEYISVGRGWSSLDEARVRGLISAALSEPDR